MEDYVLGFGTRLKLGFFFFGRLKLSCVGLMHEGFGLTDTDFLCILSGTLDVSKLYCHPPLFSVLLFCLHLNHPKKKDLQFLSFFFFFF